MRPRLFVRIMLFFSSYFPLLLIFSILFWRTHLYWALECLTVGFVSLLVTFVYIRRRLKKGGISQTLITHVEKRDENVVSYIASYLIPFVTFPLDKPEQISALLVFIGVLMILYVNSNMLYINPMLNLFGYHLYEIEIDNDDMSHYVIARGLIRPNKMLYFVRISTGVFLEKKV